MKKTSMDYFSQMQIGLYYGSEHEYDVYESNHHKHEVKEKKNANRVTAASTNAIT
jgi:hypothetical protein